MPVRDRITWGEGNPFADPRLRDLCRLIRDFRSGRLPPRWRGNRVWENRWNDLPLKPHGYYREFYVGTPTESAGLRVVIGTGGRGLHFRQPPSGLATGRWHSGELR